MTDIPPAPSSCGGPSLHTLRRFETGELELAEARRVQSHVDGCAVCQNVLRDFAADRAAVRATLPFSALEARLQKRPHPVIRCWRRLGLAAAVPALGAAAFVLWPRAPEPGVAEEPRSPITIKGEGHVCDLGFDVQSSGRPLHAWNASEELREGDRIQFRYKSEQHPYVLIVSVDADGQVFPYMSDGNRSLNVSAKEPILAATAVTLDADVRPERVMLLCSPDPLAVDEVRAAAKDGLQRAGSIERLSRLDLPRVQQTSLLLKKAPR